MSEWPTKYSAFTPFITAELQLSCTCLKVGREVFGLTFSAEDERPERLMEGLNGWKSKRLAEFRQPENQGSSRDLSHAAGGARADG